MNTYHIIVEAIPFDSFWTSIDRDFYVDAINEETAREMAEIEGIEWEENWRVQEVEGISGDVTYPFYYYSGIIDFTENYEYGYGQEYEKSYTCRTSMRAARYNC